MFEILEFIDNHLWQFVGFPLIIVLGLHLTYLSRAVQIRKFPNAIRTFVQFLRTKETCERGIHPLKAFFAGIGGCVGIGNIVGICTAVQMGGPGALLWVWITAILGVMMKYNEIFLGLATRIPNQCGGYNGGPMYILQRVFKKPLFPSLAAFLLCIYGVEIYQFSIVTHSISLNSGIDHTLVAFIVMGLVIFAVSGGVKRVGDVCSAFIPLFIILYLSMGAWVLFQNFEQIPTLISTVFVSAFTGHAAVGGFVGSTLLMTISQGIRRGCYAADVGIGYAAVIHSESSTTIPEKQASLSFVELFLDIFGVCTMSVLMVLVSGVWTESLHEALAVQTSLAAYFPYMHFFMPLFLFLLGYTTVIAYFCAGMKCAHFLSPRFGKKLYYTFGVLFLFIFTFHESHQALTVMSIVQALLLVLNGYGLFRLRHDVTYDLGKKEELALTT